MIKKVNIILLLLLISCSKVKEINNLDRLLISLNKKEEIKLSNIIENKILTIPLETKENYLIGRISKVIITDDFIFVLDIFSSQSLFMFSKKGTFIRKIGVKGDSPEEYSVPLDFIIDNKKIELVDNGSSIITYDFEGTFLNRKKTPFLINKLEKTKKGNYVFISGGTNDKLIITNTNFKKIASYFPFTNRSLNKMIANPLFKNNNGDVIFRDYLNDTLYKVDNKITPYKIFDFGSKSINKLNVINQKNVFDKCVHRMYFESNTTNYLVFIYKGEPWVYIQNNNKTSIYKFNEYINDVTFDYNTSYPIGVDNNSIVFYLEPSYLIDGLSNYSGTKNNYYHKMKKLSKYLNQNSNPILVFLNFKEIEEN